MVLSSNSGYSSRQYIIDEKYAEAPEHYVRAFLLILEDLKKLFEYIEPSSESLTTFSFRIHELLMRTCIEIEANFKAILTENTYTPNTNSYGDDIYNISIYKLINKTHHLSSYQVTLPIWNGEIKIFEPFKNWSKDDTTQQRLNWWKAYNESKHNRHEKFKDANLENLLNAISALLILLASQFKDIDFLPKNSTRITAGSSPDNMEPSIGEYFRIKFPNDWNEAEKYDFNWEELKDKDDRFQKIDYNP